MLGVPDEVPAELEGIHDVRELVGVPQAERVPELVHAGEVDDAVPDSGLMRVWRATSGPSHAVSGLM